MPAITWLNAHPIAWVVLVVLLLAGIGIPVGLWWEKNHPSSYRPPAKGSQVADDAAMNAVERREQGFVRSQAEWRRLGAQDEAYLDPAAQAVLDAEDDAREAAQHLAQINALYRP